MKTLKQLAREFDTMCSLSYGLPVDKHVNDAVLFSPAECKQELYNVIPDELSK